MTEHEMIEFDQVHHLLLQLETAKNQTVMALRKKPKDVLLTFHLNKIQSDIKSTSDIYNQLHQKFIRHIEKKYNVTFQLFRGPTMKLNGN
jgi:hypothetical protein